MSDYDFCEMCGTASSKCEEIKGVIMCPACMDREGVRFG